jgi:hypothetical protein
LQASGNSTAGGKVQKPDQGVDVFQNPSRVCCDGAAVKWPAFAVVANKASGKKCNLLAFRVKLAKTAKLKLEVSKPAAASHTSPACLQFL